MKNNILWKLDSIVEVKISGKNIHSYIKRMIIKNKINVLKLTYLSYREVLLILRYEDYLKLCEYSSIYDITIVKRYGRLRFFEFLKKNSFLFLFFALGIVFLIFLSHFIFSIEVIHSSSEIRNLIYDELEEHGISKFHLKKGYYELEEIEEDILEDNKDKLEWIEIISSGMKYIVRVEERKLNEEEEEFQYQSIVAVKNCVLYEIDAIRGEKVKQVNDYVEKGETIISGFITLADGSSSMTMASGTVLGEVWYTIEVEFPYTYYEERLTGNSRRVYVINFLGHKFSLFQFGEYRSFNRKSKVLFQNNMLDISFSSETQYEAEIISQIYTYDEALEQAISIGEEKLMKDNDRIVEIRDEDILKSEDTGSGVYVKLFVKAIEDVGAVEKIYENLDNEQ